MTLGDTLAAIAALPDDAKITLSIEKRDLVRALERAPRWRRAGHRRHRAGQHDVRVHGGSLAALVQGGEHPRRVAGCGGRVMADAAHELRSVPPRASFARHETVPSCPCPQS
jgi:hypothetical protein